MHIEKSSLIMGSNPAIFTSVNKQKLVAYFVPSNLETSS